MRIIPVLVSARLFIRLLSSVTKMPQIISEGLVLYARSLIAPLTALHWTRDEGAHSKERLGFYFESCNTI